MHKVDGYGEIGGWLQWRKRPRWFRSGRRLWIIPFVSLSPYRRWDGILCQVTVLFGWLGWEGQLWWKQMDLSEIVLYRKKGEKMRRYGPLKNAPYPKETL